MGLLLAAGSYTSCSDDDDDDKVVVVDKIVGKWQWDQWFQNGETIELTECMKKSTMEFFPNGTFVEKDFLDENMECNALGSVSGNWKYLGNNVYRFEDWEVTPDMSINVDLKITFTNNKMTLEYTEIDENDETYTVKAVYVKLG